MLIAICVKLSRPTHFDKSIEINLAILFDGLCPKLKDRDKSFGPKELSIAS
jgi:hypothetical protein